MFNIKIQYYNNARIYSNKVELSVESDGRWQYLIINAAFQRETLIEIPNSDKIIRVFNTARESNIWDLHQQLQPQIMQWDIVMHAFDQCNYYLIKSLLMISEYQ